MLKKLFAVGLIGSVAGMIWYLLTGEKQNKN